jgi:hypothetical protein
MLKGIDPKPCRHFCVASRKRPNIFNPARWQHDLATALTQAFERSDYRSL